MYWKMPISEMQGLKEKEVNGGSVGERKERQLQLGV